MKEQWKKLKLNSNYEVSTLGGVRATKSKRVVGEWLRVSKKKKLYSTVSLKFPKTTGQEKMVENIFMLDRLIAQTFCRVSGWRKMDIQHIDGNKLNNNSNNLKFIKKKHKLKCKLSI